MKGVTILPVPGVIPTSIFHRQNPRNSIVILERLTLLPQTVTQLNTLRNRAMLQLIFGSTIVADLNEAVETGGTSRSERFQRQCCTGRKPRAEIARDAVEDGVFSRLDEHDSRGDAASDLTDILLRRLIWVSVVSVVEHGCGAEVLGACHARYHTAAHHHTRHDSTNNPTRSRYITEGETTSRPQRCCRRKWRYDTRDSTRRRRRKWYTARIQSKAYTVMSAWKKVARTDRSKWTASRSHVSAHHAAHHKGVHNADRWEYGWERTYTDTTERWRDAVCWSANANANAEGRAVDGGVLLFYDDLSATCGYARMVSWWCRASVIGRRWRFAVDVGVVTDVGEPGLTYGRASSHQ